MAKYAVVEEDITVDGEPIAQVELLPGELNAPRLQDLIAAANRALERPRRPQAQASVTPPTELPPGLVNDIDEKDAAAFLVQHAVPFVGPDMGSELIKIVKRLEVVRNVYPLSPTVEAYRLALHLMIQVAAHHQSAFCTMMERIMAEDEATQR